jgi:MATE family multidrug resistance protein
MSAAITCFAPIQGLATSLDTLCAQAYGSGQKHLIGLYCQRVTVFLFCLFAPVSFLWFYSEPIILRLFSDDKVAQVASMYLQVLVFAIPGYILFETGKRFLQAQGLFRATTYILLIAAPCHAVLVWLLVDRYGFIGAPVAVAITRTVIAALLILYVKFINGSRCWGGLSDRAFCNWWPMIRLAVPGMIMVVAEWLAFEVMLIAASQFGTDYLAAQSILVAVATVSFQIPFSMSIAASTRVASLIGADLVDKAKVAAKVVCFAYLLYRRPPLDLTLTNPGSWRSLHHRNFQFNHLHGATSTASLYLHRRPNRGIPGH